MRGFDEMLESDLVPCGLGGLVVGIAVKSRVRHHEGAIATPCCEPCLFLSKLGS